jgi:hypothetical protein
VRINKATRVAREDLPLEGGPGLVVDCDMPSCGRATVLDPRPLFGVARRSWPPAGRSTRFRCACGGRLAHITYPGRPVDRYGPIDQATLALWY